MQRACCLHGPERCFRSRLGQLRLISSSSGLPKRLVERFRGIDLATASGNSAQNKSSEVPTSESKTLESQPIYRPAAFALPEEHQRGVDAQLKLSASSKWNQRPPLPPPPSFRPLPTGNANAPVSVSPTQLAAVQARVQPKYAWHAESPTRPPQPPKRVPRRPNSLSPHESEAVESIGFDRPRNNRSRRKDSERGPASPKTEAQMDREDDAEGGLFTPEEWDELMYRRKREFIYQASVDIKTGQVFYDPETLPPLPDFWEFGCGEWLADEHHFDEHPVFQMPWFTAPDVPVAQTPHELFAKYINYKNPSKKTKKSLLPAVASPRNIIVAREHNLPLQLGNTSANYKRFMLGDVQDFTRAPEELGPVKHVQLALLHSGKDMDVNRSKHVVQIVKAKTESVTSPL